MRHIIAILVENESGALSRILGLFSARGYNIESITVAPTEDLSLSRLTIATQGSADFVEQICKQLYRLVEVVKVTVLNEAPYIERELMFVKVRAVGKDREELKRLTDIFRGTIIDISTSTYTIEVTGRKEKNQAFLDNIDAEKILETVRTGTAGISRGERCLKV